MHRVKVRVVEDALDANNTIARANRDDFDRHGVAVVNLMSAPGAGKTSLLERALERPLGDGIRVGVLEGDVQGEYDATRIASLHVPVTQINTDSGFGGECHLDANMVRTALPSVPLAEIDLLVIENVGNLVCPAEFRVGEDVRVMVAAITEGEDKPLKYPLMRARPDQQGRSPAASRGRPRGVARQHRRRAPGRRDDGRERAQRRGGRAVAPLAGRARDRPLGRAGDMSSAVAEPVAELLARGLAARREAGARLVERDAARIAELCHAVAERCARGGRLLACACSPAGASDARHVAVEFVHPVIVGKRALPALALLGERGPLAGEVALLAREEDVVLVLGEAADGPALTAALSAARARGSLTLAFAPLAAEWVIEPPSTDPYVCQELVEVVYHIVWELSHVFFEHRGLLAGRSERRGHDAGASSFLYPFLDERESDLAGVLADVRDSVVMKARETEALREQTVREGGEALAAAAAALRQVFERGGTLLALGNGGSATDAMDIVADLSRPLPGGAGTARRALDLSADPAVVTAIANDIGPQAVFARQVIAHGGVGDALIAFSTSGDSRSVIDALAEARKRGLVTIALVGYDGGRVAADGLADHLVISRSQHIPRIQEAHATASHLLRELIEAGEGGQRP
jgi:D-sedoheptulose 7-phosphate isomerase